MKETLIHNRVPKPDLYAERLIELLTLGSSIHALDKEGVECVETSVLSIE